MKRKHLAGVIVCITVMVWLLSSVNDEINAVEQDTVVMSQKSSDKIQDGMHDCLDHKESGRTDRDASGLVRRDKGVCLC